MNRIDEIEGRFNKWVKSNTFSADGVYEEILRNATVDIEHLLSVIKIAEKALEEITKSTYYTEYESTHEILLGIKKTSESTLQQIRGG